MKKITWNDVMKFDLRENPVIFDLGGFKGDWTKEALDRYDNPIIYIFEPVKNFYTEIKKRYESNQNIKVFNFGLSSCDKKINISVDSNKSSRFVETDNKEEITIKNIKQFLFDEKIFHVDLIKINIEGEEYDLLEYLTSIQEITIFKNYLIQFHPFVPDYLLRKKNITEQLSIYFDQIFNYEMVFEGWRIKKIKETYCLGDSHISIFANSDTLIPENTLTRYDNFLVFRSGPTLAYNVQDKKNIQKFVNQIESSKNLLICYGEIDCRAQVHRLINEKKDYRTVIDIIIERYVSFLQSIKIKYLILFSITPEFKENPHFYYYKDHPEVFDSPKGTLEERNLYKKYFNQRLKDIAEENNWIFVSIFEYVLSVSKNTSVFLLDDIHLKGKNVYYLLEHAILSSSNKTHYV